MCVCVYIYIYIYLNIYIYTHVCIYMYMHTKVPLEENLAMIADSIAAIVAAGREAMFDCEHFFDGYKANPDYAVVCDCLCMCVCVCMSACQHVCLYVCISVTICLLSIYPSIHACMHACMHASIHPSILYVYVWIRPCTGLCACGARGRGELGGAVRYQRRVLAG